MQGTVRFDFLQHNSAIYFIKKENSLAFLIKHYTGYISAFITPSKHFTVYEAYVCVGGGLGISHSFDLAGTFECPPWELFIFLVLFF